MVHNAWADASCSSCGYSLRHGPSCSDHTHARGNQRGAVCAGFGSSGKEVHGGCQLNPVQLDSFVQGVKV